MIFPLAPPPEVVRLVPMETLERLREIVPPGTGFDENGSVQGFLKLIDGAATGERMEFFQLVTPIAQLALDHFQEVEEVRATDMRLTVMNSDDRVRTDTEAWHADRVFPHELLYMVASNDSTEFAVGSSALLTKVPEKISINGAAKALIKLGRLKIEQAQPGSLIAFGRDHIHRRPALSTGGRISVQFSIFNQSLSLSALEESWMGRRKLAWADWRNPLPY